MCATFSISCKSTTAHRRPSWPFGKDSSSWIPGRSCSCCGHQVKTSWPDKRLSAFPKSNDRHVFLVSHQHSVHACANRGDRSRAQLRWLVVQGRELDSIILEKSQVSYFCNMTSCRYI